MARPKSLKPKYCNHAASGRAYVTIDGQRVYLGPHGSQASRDKYDRAIGEWIARGRTAEVSPAAVDGISIPELIDAYFTHAQTYYLDADGKPTPELGSLRIALRFVQRLYGDSTAAAFGPKAMRTVRQAMLDAEPDPEPKPKSGSRRVKWSRQHVNRQIARIRQMFKWAVAHELVVSPVYQALCAVEGLRSGRTTAPETEPVEPVALEHVEVVLPFLSRQLQALVRLQLLTGARGGELLGMRTCDLDRKGDVWTYKPRRHKTAHHGHKRVIRIGPKGRQILRPLLKMDPQAFIFSPVDAEAERREALAQERAANGTPLSCGNKPGSNRKKSPRRKPRDRYDKHSYARAVARACDEAFPPPADLACGRVPAPGRKKATRLEKPAEWKDRLGPVKWAELKAWRKAHRFHPHQLRHSAATFIASVEGLELARIILGHRHVQTTLLYAEADQKKAEKIMRRIG